MAHLITLIAFAPMLAFLWAIFAVPLGGLGGALAVALMVWLATRYGD